jgi:mannose-6-phosphate isomerase-like protein (cupin superfamily)
MLRSLTRVKRYFMEIEKINIEEKLNLFNDYWNPRIAGNLNGQLIKLVKFKGEFIWHKHDNEDEMFLVINGEFNMELRDKTIPISKGDFIIIPRGTEHRPVAVNEVHVMLFEPATTLNTGNVVDTKLTRQNLSEV